MPSKSKCRLCGGDVFNADISSGIITCVRCGQQYSMGASKKEQPQPQPQRSTQTFPMTDTSSPSDFKIAFGVLKKYTGNSKHVVIPEGVTEIAAPNGEFVFNPSLESIRLPKSLKVIGFLSFAGTDIKKIDIPHGVTKIDTQAFMNCSKLNNISFPNTLIEIGKNAFENCGALTSIVIPASVLSIGDGIFTNCSLLSSVKLNYGLQTIGSRAFTNCKSLTSIVIPDSVMEIKYYRYSSASYVFDGCYMLTEVSYPSRFSPDVFRGTAWFDKIGATIYIKEKREQALKNGECPKCGSKLSIFKSCPVHGKNY